MTALELLSPFIRAFLALWALLLCLCLFLSTLLAVRKRRYLFSGFSAALCIPAYLMEQCLFDLSLSAKTGVISGVTETLCSAPWIVWLTVYAVLTIAAILLLAYNIHYDKTFITPESIKAYLDQIPCGVCCWHDNGKVLFSNVCMNGLCQQLTGEPLLNGNQFRETVSGEIISIGERKWRFSCGEALLNGEHLHDMIASDITAEYAKTQALEKDRAELARITRELREYSRGIDEMVRHQEILQAKVNIHNEMNRLMLSSVAAESGDSEALDTILSLWEQNALLLCMEASDAADSQAISRIEGLAKALHIHLVWQSDLPATLSERQRALFFSAAQEAVSNAAKHANATELQISFSARGPSVRCSFANNGQVRDSDVSFSGGLANLQRLAEKQGATVSVSTDDRFVLSLAFPAENPSNG